MYEKIARWYRQGLWSEIMVLNAVNKNIITREQANVILKGDK